MKHLRVFVRRFSGVFRKDQHDRELAEEIESNLELHIADNLRAGMSPKEARRQALMKLGGMEATKEVYRDQLGMPVFDTLLQDIRYGLRGLRRSPGFAVTAILTLALGIGATTAIFSAVYALLIRPLPYRDPDRLVWIARQSLSGGSGAIAAPDMIAWRERGRPFEAVGGYAPNEYTLTGAGDAIRIPVEMVSTNFLSLLGAVPQFGRDFIPADGHRGSARVAILSDTLWRERFNSDPRVVGTGLDLDGEPYTVVGVLPPRFRFPSIVNAPQMLIAWHAPDSSAFNAREPSEFLQVLGRLRPGDSLASVQTELQLFQQTRLRDYPAPLARLAEGSRLVVTPLQRHLAGDSRKPLMVLLVSVGVVLLIACANIANLQLVRAAARRHEVAVRGALGAARMRLARQVLTESMVISLFAAAAGLAIGAFSIDIIRGWQSPELPWLASVSLDPYVFGFSLGVAVLAALLFGAAPAISGSRANLLDALKTSPVRMPRMRDHRMLRNTFVAGEVALALVLLIAAGLLVRSFRNLMRTDPGYDPHNVLTASVQLAVGGDVGAAGNPDSDRTALNFASALLPQLKALPAVRSAALTGRLPLQPHHTNTMVWFGPAPPPRETWGSLVVPRISVSPELFAAMDTPILQGRGFQEQDNQGSPAVAIVNRAFAQRFYSGGAVGQWFNSMLAENCAGCLAGKPVALQVIGIAADVHEKGLDSPAEPAVYVPFAQAPEAGFNIVLAIDGNPGALAAPLRSTVFALDRQVPVYDMTTLEQRLSEWLAQRRLTMFLLSTFAALALLLAGIGVYGVISYSVVERTQEIGIRMALGSTRGGVLRLILGQQARMILLGSAAGLALAIALNVVLESLLYGVKPRDFTTFASSWVILALIALLASAAPALRATRADPSVTLRSE